MDANRFTRGLDNYIARLKSKIESEYNRVLKEAYRELANIVDVKVRELFETVVKEYYDSYSPLIYERNYSLNNILHISVGEDSISLGFDPGSMTPYRSGYSGEDGLYTTVFREGWHGGAKKGPGHPNPGTAYWRYPPPEEDSVQTGYYQWGRPAERMSIVGGSESGGTDTSPLQRFKDILNQYNNDGIQKDFDIIFDKKMKTMQIKW